MDCVHFFFFLDVWGLSLKAGQGLDFQIPPGLSMAFSATPMSFVSEEESGRLRGLGHWVPGTAWAFQTDPLLPPSDPAAVKRQFGGSSALGCSENSVAGSFCFSEPGSVEPGCSQSKNVLSRPGALAS